MPALSRLCLYLADGRKDSAVRLRRLYHRWESWARDHGECSDHSHHGDHGAPAPRRRANLVVEDGFLPCSPPRTDGAKWKFWNVGNKMFTSFLLVLFDQ